MCVFKPESTLNEKRNADYAAVRLRVMRQVHFSTADQAQETARRHFHGQADLVVLAVETDTLGPALRWEPSRGGQLFPHLYGPLDTAHVIDITEAPLDGAGVPQTGALRP